MPAIQLVSRRQAHSCDLDGDYKTLVAHARYHGVALPVQFDGPPRQILIQQWPDMRNSGFLFIKLMMCENWHVKLVD